MIIPNQWAILRDPVTYPDHDSFLPDRWLKPGYPTYQAPLTIYPNLKRFAAFGHGRRLCPGLEVAENALLIQAASLFWACNVRKKRGENGKEIGVPFYDYSGTLIHMPKEFEFALEERVEGRLAMMEQAAKRDHDEELAAQEL
jgi:hypothetical protein